MSSIKSELPTRKMMKTLSNRNENRTKLICAIVFAILSSLSLLTIANIPDVWRENSIQIAQAKFFEATYPVGLIGTILACFLFYFYRRTIFSKEYDIPVRISQIVFSVLLSIFVLIALSFNAYDSLAFIIANRFQAGFSFLLLIGFIPFFYAAINVVFALTNKIVSIDEEYTPPKFFNLIATHFDRRPFLIPFIVFLVLWSPYWLISFPGVLYYDFMDQMDVYFGFNEWTDHHPVLSTMVLGGLMQAGRALVNDNFGIVLISLYQHLVAALVCAYALKTIRTWSIPGLIKGLVFIFLAFNPLIIYWLSIAVKNTSSASLFLLFTILYLECILRIKNNKPIIKTLLFTIVVGSLAALFRHDLLYVVSISLVLLAVIKQSGKTRIISASSGIVCFLVITIISGSFNNYFGIESKRINPEGLAIPFQQTARFVFEHGDDVKPWEKEAISAILDYDALPDLYTPGNADPVKATASDDINDEDFKAFLRAWFSMFQRQPVTFLEATLGNSYAYYSPYVGSHHKAIIIINHRNIQSLMNYNVGWMLFQESTRQQLYLATIGIPQNLPGINIFYYLGNYTWFLLLLMLGLFIKKKYIYLLGFAPALLVILTCIASPVNGYFRYYIPVMMVVPILLAWAIYSVYQKQASNISQKTDEKNDENILQ